MKRVIGIIAGIVVLFGGSTVAATSAQASSGPNWGCYLSLPVAPLYGLWDSWANDRVQTICAPTYQIVENPLKPWRFW